MSKVIQGIDILIFCSTTLHSAGTKARFKRRILHAPNQILILVDSNEYIRLI